MMNGDTQILEQIIGYASFPENTSSSVLNLLIPRVAVVIWLFFTSFISQTNWILSSLTYELILNISVFPESVC